MTTLGFTHELSHSDTVALGRAARSFDGAQICDQLLRLRKYLRDFVATMAEPQLRPPVIETINPPLWEAAHVAWVAEWWCVRGAYNNTSGETLAARPSVWRDCDSFLNSNISVHKERWRLPQLTRAATLDYLDRSLSVTLHALERAEQSDAGLYPFRLVMFHEAMHLEALAWTAQTLAWPRPAWVPARPADPMGNDGALGSVDIDFSQTIAEATRGFTFDNERNTPPPLTTRASINGSPVYNEEMLQFVNSGEFEVMTGNPYPTYWREETNGWQQRRFNEWFDLDMDEPVVHVSAIEAEAYCQYAGQRLPTEVEMHTLCRAHPLQWGRSVWEWTATPFAPYAGFSADRYREYSQPWFDGKHRVLRGGSFATLDIMHHADYRNFFLPQRNDVFAGFRTVSLGD
jgi:gamma-glutamyl hercynylcysteine S-oxide synthase